MMPDVDGFTLAAQIAGDDRLAATKVILLTSAGLGRARGVVGDGALRRAAVQAGQAVQTCWTPS